MRRILMVVLIAGAAVKAGAQETTRFLAAATHASGARGTFWKTDVRVFNPSASAEITVFLAFLRSEADNRGAAEIVFAIPPRRAVALDDLVATVFQASGSGGVRLRSAQPFLATSKTYNIGNGTSGTYGGLVPGLEPGEALAQGILLQVANDPSPTGFRSNVGFLNPGTSSVTVDYRLFDAGSATLLGTGSLNLPPLAFLQVNDVFGSSGAGATITRNGTVEFVASAPVFAFASVIDNTSGDAVIVLPDGDSGTPVASARPLALDDSFVAVAGVPLTVPATGLLGNDVDSEGRPLTALLVNGPAQPHGSLVLDPQGSFVYQLAATPTAPLEDSFTYRASNGAAESNTATVRVAVLPGPTISDIGVSYRLDPWLISGNYGGGFWVAPAVLGPVVVGRGGFSLQVRAEGLSGGTAATVSPTWITADPSIVTVSPSQGRQVTLTVRRIGRTSVYVIAEGVRTTLIVNASDFQGTAMELTISRL